jgi:chromate reductase
MHALHFCLICLISFTFTAATATRSAAIGADGVARSGAPPLLALCGSLRARSANCALARAAAAASPAVALAPRLDLPLFDADVEAEGYPPAVRALREQARASAGFVFAIPEYNAAPSGVFKNALDWLSRPGPEGASPIKGKPFVVLSAGGASGGARAQRALQAMVADAGMKNAGAGAEPVAVKLFDGTARFDAQGNLTDSAVLALVAAQVRALEAAAAAQGAQLAAAAVAPAA